MLAQEKPTVDTKMIKRKESMDITKKKSLRKTAREKERNKRISKQKRVSKLQ